MPDCLKISIPGGRIHPTHGNPTSRIPLDPVDTKTPRAPEIDRTGRTIREHVRTQPDHCQGVSFSGECGRGERRRCKAADGKIMSQKPAQGTTRWRMRLIIRRILLSRTIQRVKDRPSRIALKSLEPDIRPSEILISTAGRGRGRGIIPWSSASAEAAAPSVASH